MSIPEIVAAIKTIHDPHATPQGRKDAETMCRNVVPSLPLVQELLQSHDLHLEHFALNLVLSLIKSQPTHIRDVVLQLDTVWSSKCAQCYAELAKRIWPFQWPSFDPFLVSLYETKPLVVLETLRLLCEDVFLYEDPVCMKRKQAMVTCMLSIATDAEYFTTQHGDTDLIRCLSRPGNGGWIRRLLQSLQDASDVKLRRSILQTLALFLEWVPLDYLERCGIVGSLMVYLGHMDWNIVQDTLDCYLVLYYRNIQNPEIRMQVGWNPVLEGGLEKWMALWYRIHSSFRFASISIAQNESVLSPDEHKTAVKCAHVICAFVERIVCFKGNRNAFPQLDKLLDFLWCLIRHPSPLVIAYGMEAVHSMLKHDHCRTWISGDAYLPILVPLLLRRTDFKSQLYIQYAEYEFEHVEECDQIVSPNLFLQDLKLLAEIRPLYCFRWMSQLVRGCFAGNLSEFSVKQVSYSVQAVGSCSATSEIAKKKEWVDELKELLTGLVSLEISDPHVLVYVIPMVATFSVVLPTFPDIALPVLEKLTMWSVFCPPEEQNCIPDYKEFSKDTALVRHAAASSLLKMASKIPDLMMMHIQQMAPFVIQLIQSNKYFSYEARLMMEVLVSIVMASASSEKQHVLDAILNVHREDLVRLEALLSSRDTFMNHIGLDAVYEYASNPLVSKEILEKGITERRWFLDQFVHFGQYLKRSLELFKKHQAHHDLWNAYIHQLVPLCVQTIVYVHELWAPQQRYNSVFLNRLRAPTALEIGQTISMSKQEVKPVADTDVYFDSLWKWLSRVREQCYSFLSTCCYYPTFYQLPVADMTVRMLQNAQCISLHHWRSLLHTYIIAMVIQCPQNLFSSIVGPIVPSISAHVCRTLEIAWQARDPNAPEPEIDDEITDDIAQDLILRIVSRSFAELWHKVFGFKEERSFRYPALVEYCFGVPELVEEWTKSIVMMMAMRDTVTCRTSMDVASRIVPFLINIPASWGFLDRLMKASITVLMDGYHTTNHHQAASLIAEIYMALRPLSTIPADCLRLIPGTLEQEIQVHPVHVGIGKGVGRCEINQITNSCRCFLF
jgi:hypothetical protein